MRIDELITLADRALESEMGSDAFISCVEQYLSAFRQWIDAFDGDSQETQARQTKLLQTKHDEILLRAKEAAAGTMQNLKGLRQRGKALVSYIDTLPKQISRTKVKKG